MISTLTGGGDSLLVSLTIFPTSAVLINDFADLPVLYRLSAGG